jgi:hypothetical protein
MKSTFNDRLTLVKLAFILAILGAIALTSCTSQRYYYQAPKQNNCLKHGRINHNAAY